MQIVRTGDTVEFHNGSSEKVEGVVEAIAPVLSEAIFSDYCRYQIKGVWYSDPEFRVVRGNLEPRLGGDLVRFVDRFYKIPVTLPGFFLEMIGYCSECRYFAIYYRGSKATWHSGHGLATFSYFAAYEPLVSHPAIHSHVGCFDLGSDDSEAEYCIILDINVIDAIELYLVPFAKGMEFVKDAAPKLPKLELSREEIEEFLERYREKFQSMSTAQMQGAGMFEMFIGNSQQQRQRVGQLVNHLNQYLQTAHKKYLLSNLTKLF